MVLSRAGLWSVQLPRFARCLGRIGLLWRRVMRPDVLPTVVLDSIRGPVLLLLVWIWVSPEPPATHPQDTSRSPVERDFREQPSTYADGVEFS
jgi:hypothetical protein